MRIIINAQAEWRFFTNLHQLFVQALPPKGRGSEPLDVENAKDRLRQSLRSIPLQIDPEQLSQDLRNADFSIFLEALQSLLTLFEDMVDEDIAGRGHNIDANLGETTQFQDQYPKLVALESQLQKSKLEVDAEDFDPRHTSVGHPSGSLAELTRYIDFQDLDLIDHKIRAFNKIVQNTFPHGNPSQLMAEEIEFIHRARHVHSLSESLFKCLASSIICSKVHNTRLHLSGFLTLDFNLLVEGCETNAWHLSDCQWNPDQPTDWRHVRHDTLFERADAMPRRIQMAFNEDEIWEDSNYVDLSDSDINPEHSLTLSELLFSNTHLDWMSDGCEFEPEDHKIVELLLAYSLFHLNTSCWLRTAWDTDSVLIFPTPSLENLLQRWRPYIACSLEPSLSNRDDIDDILSFGLLIMEMEAKRKASLTNAELDWVTGLPSKDSMLKKVLTDWDRKVEAGYRKIGDACLRFRELAHKLHHDSLTEDMKRTAAIYKYILYPLCSLVSQKFPSTPQLFRGFPGPSENLSSSNADPIREDLASNLVLFDESSPRHDSEKAEWASEFRTEIKPFVDMIRRLDYANPAEWAPWRTERIRIAIIDTGIDDEDILIETALKNRRIKDCRGFMDSPNDHKDVHGHGTHVARLLLEMAPLAELYIAKISDSIGINAADLSRISEAIKWTQDLEPGKKTKKVHMISMSFGLEHAKHNKDIDRAIFEALNSNTTIFAAAANNGGNKPRAYPARRSRVVCVHASDGRGNNGGISPSPEPKKDNFSTLGICIESIWKGETVWKSGTSFATPIAVSMAANILEFARRKCRMSLHEWECFYNYDGVSAILRWMSQERDQYDYITPFHIWNSRMSEADFAREIAAVCPGS